MPTTHDAIIIGAGHNGLVTAFYLAKAGLKPLLLERRSAAGGAALTDEFHPGFKCSTLAHCCGPLRSDIWRDMQLERHDLQMIQPDPRVFAPSPDGRALLLYHDLARSAQEIARFSKRDAVKFTEFQGLLGRLAAVMAKKFSETPPAIDNPSSGDLLKLFTVVREVRKLGRKELSCLLRWMPMAVADLVGEWFENELLRAVIAARGIFGTFLGPCSPGSGAVFLVRTASDAHPAGPACFPKGGMGALVQAMTAAVQQAGGEIRTGAHVRRIIIKEGRATGAVLSSGEEVTASLVISNADPKRTFLGLIDPVHLDPDFLGKMQNYRSTGATAKVNLALAGLPTFAALPAKGVASSIGSAGGQNNTPEVTIALAGRIHIGPEIDYLERAFDDAKYGRFSRNPYLDIVIPSLSDPSLAPPGQHVMSICAQFAPFKLRPSSPGDDADWDTQRENLGDAVVNALSTYAPDLPGLILRRQVITPADLEETYSLTGGHIFHGDLALDQLFAMRPLLGWARYRTPIRGLYLCGSGTHPGTGLTGASGANAAREILKDWKRKKA